MQPFIVQTTSTLEDWRAQRLACALRMRQLLPGWRKWAQLAVIGIAWAALAATAAALEMTGMVLFFGYALAIVFNAVTTRWNLRLFEPKQADLSKPLDLEFDAEGFRLVTDGTDIHIQWRRVKDVTSTSQHIFIWIETFISHVVPVRGLPPDVSPDEAVARIRHWVAQSSQQQISQQSETSPVAHGRLRSKFRLLTLRTVSASAFPGSIISIVWSTVLSLALWAMLDRLRFASDAEFYPYTSAGIAWYVLAAVATIAVMAYRSHPAISFSRASAIVTTVLPLILLADFVIDTSLPEDWIWPARVALGLYAIVYCARAMESLTGAKQPAAITGGVAVTALFLILGNALYVQPSLWLENESSDDESGEPNNTWRNGETVLFEQSARIDSAVDQVAPSDGEGPEGFFVGFAGYGEQRVFAEEIEFASQKFDERYDTGARSLLLLNDRRDLDSAPIASVSSLQYALKAVASRMQVDRDVLFLVLSSHGSEEPLLSVSNGGLPLRDLNGEALAAALRGSGIKWKVVVISACHAGAFIEPLKDPNTIVITAAAADRTSFGCSDDRDLTYFGEAFFRDALPATHSLRDAFEQAKVLVSERERAQGFKASNPQAFFGEQVEKQLARLHVSPN